MGPPDVRKAVVEKGLRQLVPKQKCQHGCPWKIDDFEEENGTGV